MAKKPSKSAAAKKRLKPNKPVPSYKPDKKFMVLAKQGDTEKLIHFGAKGYGHNYSAEARKAFRSRMSCDSDKPKNLSARYWSCEYLWKEGGRKRTKASKGGAAKKKKY